MASFFRIRVPFELPESVLHVQGHTNQMGKPDEKRAEVIITGVVQKFPDGWKIVAFQNTPVEQRSGPPPRS